MAKKKNKKKLIKKNNQAKPSSLQLKAIERLWDKNEKEQALARVEKLLKKYPKFALLYVHGMGLYSELKQPHKASWIALRWTQASPNSLQAWGSLLSLCIKSGYVALAHECIQRYNHLAKPANETPILSPSLEAIKNDVLDIRPDNSQPETLEDALLFDQGRLLTDAGQWQASLPYFEASIHYPPAANNYALALFQLGRINDAQDAYHAAFKRHTDNLYAMTAYIRLLVWKGQMNEANAYADKLKNAHPIRPLYVEAQLMGLSFMGRYADAYSCYQRLNDDDISNMEPTFFHLAASIAFHVNEKELAKKLWLDDPAEQNRGNETNPIALLNARQETRRNPAIFANSELIPISWFDIIKTAIKKGNGDEEIIAFIQQDIPSYPSLDYFKLSYETVDDAGLFALEFILASHAKQGNEDVKKTLMSFLKSHRTDPSYKVDFIKRLKSTKIVQEEDKIDYWNGDTIGTLNTFGLTITYEAAKEDLSPNDQDLYYSALHRLKERKVEEAHKILHTLAEKHPTATSIRGNAIAALALLDKEKANKEYAALMEEFPDYIFARCMLVQHKIDAGQLEDAEHLLQNVLPTIRTIHIEDYLFLQGVSAYLHAAKGNRKEVNTFIEAMQYAAQDETDNKKILYWKSKTARMLMLHPKT